MNGYSGHFEEYVKVSLPSVWSSEALQAEKVLNTRQKSLLFSALYMPGQAARFLYTWTKKVPYLLQAVDLTIKMKLKQYTARETEEFQQFLIQSFLEWTTRTDQDIELGVTQSHGTMFTYIPLTGLGKGYLYYAASFMCEEYLDNILHSLREKCAWIGAYREKTARAERVRILSSVQGLKSGNRIYRVSIALFGWTLLVFCDGLHCTLIISRIVARTGENLEQKSHSYKRQKRSFSENAWNQIRYIRLSA